LFTALGGCALQWPISFLDI